MIPGTTLARHESQLRQTEGATTEDKLVVVSGMSGCYGGQYGDRCLFVCDAAR
jgi:hypothetical protein